jgi:hypothetical protein
MKRTILLTVLIVISPFLSSGLLEAERRLAPKVEPIIYKGIKFIVPNTPEKMGIVEGWATEANKKIWENQVYSIVINPIIEQDVQWIFISSLSIEDEKLVVVDERSHKYKIAIPKNILKERIQPLKLTIKSDKEAYGIGEEIDITVNLTNISSKQIIIAEDGLLYPVFDIIGPDQRPVENTCPRPTMLPPDISRFITLQPKESYVVKTSSSDCWHINRIGEYKIIKKAGFDNHYWPNNKGMPKLLDNAWTGALVSSAITVKVAEKNG